MLLSLFHFFISQTYRRVRTVIRYPAFTQHMPPNTCNLILSQQLRKGLFGSTVDWLFCTFLRFAPPRFGYWIISTVVLLHKTPFVCVALIIFLTSLAETQNYLFVFSFSILSAPFSSVSGYGVALNRRGSASSPKNSLLFCVSLLNVLVRFLFLFLRSRQVSRVQLTDFRKLIRCRS